MVAPVSHNIVQGETLLFEVRFIGEDLSDATPRIETSSGMSPADFTATKSSTDTVQVKATSTGLFSTGVHDLFLWLDWSSGDVASEVGLHSHVCVSEAPDWWDEGEGVIDGGAAATEHEDAVDGGGA